jgi:hypothetical protein
MAALRAPLPASADWRAMIRFATLAANGHNTQPLALSRERAAGRYPPRFLSADTCR